MAAILILSLANLISRCFSKYQQLTATTNIAPIIHDDVTVWQNLSIAKGEKATSVNDVISKRIVSGLNC